MKRKTVLMTAFGFLVIASLFCKDANWPEWYGVTLWHAVEGRMLPGVSLWAALLGLVIEYPFMRLLFGLGVVKAVWVDIRVNVASIFLVYLVLTVSGLACAAAPGHLAFLFAPVYRLALAVLPGPLVLALLHRRTVNLILWAATFLLAAGINAGVQSMVVQSDLKTRIDKKGFWGLFAANLTSLGVASVSFLLKNPGPY